MTSEAEDLEATTRTIIESVLQIDWWTHSESLALLDSMEAMKLNYLFVVDARFQLLLAKTASTMLANLLLKCCDVVLGKLRDISFESFMNLCNAPLSGSSELSQGGLGKSHGEV